MMGFDSKTRNVLAGAVNVCRKLLVKDATDQLGGFGLFSNGQVLSADQLTNRSPDQMAAARNLRTLLDHHAVAGTEEESERRRAAYGRMVLEIASTALNRLAALRLCEERGLIIECVGKELASDGFKLFESRCDAQNERHDDYRVFLECYFDEFALDLGVLFDRMTPQSAVFPSARCLTDVLAELNKPELADLWIEDETIGWIYQYFNPPEERKTMRKASSNAPRNSRELIIRTQFFTPRYVVEFLADNTLGRIWYEMRRGDTALGEQCRYLSRHQNEFLACQDESTHFVNDDEAELGCRDSSQELNRIEHRPKKDPRDLRILDPACGSGHFLLYCFDLLERIYEEAWSDPESPKSEATDSTVRKDYEVLESLRLEVPKLIIERNLHGIEIDPRATQIAALALWLRAQKAWKNLGIKARERPVVTQSNIVAAEPMPGEDDLRLEFTTALQPRVLGQIVDEVFAKMSLAGEAGTLLKIEDDIKGAVAAAERQWSNERLKGSGQIQFPERRELGPKQRFDVNEIADGRFWEGAEGHILGALKHFAEQAGTDGAMRRGLFAADTARGFAFIDLCRKRYDVVLMNPPYSNFSQGIFGWAASAWPRAKKDTFAAFVERGVMLLLPRGRLGAITSRTGFFHKTLEDWRKKVLLEEATPSVVADLGPGIIDGATVNVAAYCLEKAT
jgi:hypothetical protein